jgi:hypothetical protein
MEEENDVKALLEKSSLPINRTPLGLEKSNNIF